MAALDVDPPALLTVTEDVSVGVVGSGCNEKDSDGVGEFEGNDDSDILGGPVAED